MPNMRAAETVFGGISCPMRNGEPVMLAACRHCEHSEHDCETERAKQQDRRYRQAAREGRKED